MDSFFYDSIIEVEVLFELIVQFTWFVSIIGYVPHRLIFFQVPKKIAELFTPINFGETEKRLINNY